MGRSRQVVVWHPVGDPQQMPFLRGISDFARQRCNWVLHVNPELFSLRLRDLAGWPGDGLIAALRTRAEVAAARKLRMPVVNLAGAIKDAGLPRVMVDQTALGTLAADHLLACGLSRFAYFGERENWYSQQRREGFVARLAGLPCSVFEPTTHFGRRNPWYRWNEPLERWLATLQPPVGLLAVHDYAGSLLVAACLRLGLRVPEDVAVVGVGNDTITCEFCEVPLTSVARSNYAVGYRAALLLDRLMSGQRAPKQDVLLPPEGVVARRSTEVLVVDDRHVQHAVEYMSQHAGEPLTISQLCQALGISHRLLNLRFRKRLGCAPLDLLNQLRVKRAKQLLATDHTCKLQAVANACGFTTVRHLRAAFRRITGQTPAQFRQGV